MSDIMVIGEPLPAGALPVGLRARRYSVVTATWEEALDQAGQDKPDAVVLDLDLELPDVHGVELICALRVTTAAPIIAVSHSTATDDTIRALDAGADDYLTKPFAVDELLARLRATLRRGPVSAGQRRVALGANVVDLTAGTVTGPHGPIRLTNIEWKLLCILLASPGMIVPGQRIFSQVWGPERQHHSNYLRVHFTNLRRKLEADPAHPRHLITEYGRGYRFIP